MPRPIETPTSDCEKGVQAAHHWPIATMRPEPPGSAYRGRSCFGPPAVSAFLFRRVRRAFGDQARGPPRLLALGESPRSYPEAALVPSLERRLRNGMPQLRPQPGMMPAAFAKPALDEISSLTKASNCAEGQQHPHRGWPSRQPNRQRFAAGAARIIATSICISAYLISPSYLPNRSGPCDNIFTRKRPSAAVK